MNGNYIAAGSTLERLANQFKSVVELADILKEVGSLDQAANEAQLRLAAVRADEAAAEKRLEEVHAAIAEGEQKLKAMLEDAQSKATELVGKARDKAIAIAAEADLKFQERTSQAEQHLESTNQRIAAAQADAHAQFTNVHAEIEQLTSQRDAIADEHEKWVTKLAQIKDHAATILQG